MSPAILLRLSRQLWNKQGIDRNFIRNGDHLVSLNFKFCFFIYSFLDTNREVSSFTNTFILENQFLN